MSNQTTEKWIRSLQEVIISAIVGILITLCFIFLQDSIGATFPSVNQITGQLWAAVQIWTDIASIESPRSYALNTVVIVTVISAILNSWNRDSPSSTISGILLAPGMAIWSKLITKLATSPFIGTIVHGFGGAARLYLWVISMSMYFVYPILYVLDSDASLLVVTVSTVLASVTFGAVFGRFEKGLVLSIKSVSKSLQNREIQSQSKLTKYYWGSMIPLSLIGAVAFTYLSLSSLEQPTFGEFFASASSVFLTTFLTVIVIFYLFAMSVVILLGGYRSISSYRNGDWELRKEIQARFESYIEEELKRGRDEDKMTGYPDEVADALRDDSTE